MYLWKRWASQATFLPSPSRGHSLFANMANNSKTMWGKGRTVHKTIHKTLSFESQQHSIMPANCQLWGCDVASMCDFLFSDSLKIVLTGEKLAHKFGVNNLSWWKQPMKTKGKTVELDISGIRMETPEPVGPSHTSVFLGDMPRKGMVQKRCHNNCDNDWRTKKYIENIVELHPSAQKVI